MDFFVVRGCLNVGIANARYDATRMRLLLTIYTLPKQLFPKLCPCSFA
jgi:hypothetical protein